MSGNKQFIYVAVSIREIWTEGFHKSEEIIIHGVFENEDCPYFKEMNWTVLKLETGEIRNININQLKKVRVSEVYSED
jgi:hypothetical protein